MSFSKTLLAGVALCGLSAAPAMARSLPPNIHLAFTGAHLSTKPALHLKTNIHDPKLKNYTQTATFSASISHATDTGVPVEILKDTWYDTQNCATPTKEKWVGLPARTQYAKVTQSTSTGSISGCSGTYTFHDINYDLLRKTGTSDVVSGNLVAKDFIGYNLKLIATVDITLTK